MNRTPEGWTRIASSVFYADANRAIDWLCDAFGFTVRLKVEGEGGRIEHSELTFGDGMICVGSADGRSHKPGRATVASPRELHGRNTQRLCVFVDDVDSFFAHAVSRGAAVVEAPQTHDYGAEYWADRSCQLVDLEGHHWYFMQRVRG